MECAIQIAQSNNEVEAMSYKNIKFGNYPNDDNIYCMMCPHQLDCMKVSK